MFAPDRRSDEALLARALEDEDAFAAFYRRYERRMVGFFVRAVGRGDLAADLTAEVFAEALSAAPASTPSSAADQRDALHARVIDEAGYGEIAERLQCSESVVRKRVSRGLATRGQ